MASSSPVAGSPHPYIPATGADRARMLERIGVPDVDALFSDLPAAMRDPAIHLPPALAEPDLVALLEQIASGNSDPARPSFLGAGAYRRSIPAITAHLVGRSEFATSYTPYQPEISQGTLQAAFEYQSVVCELTGMDVSNAGLYDVATATAEACLLASRVTRRRAVALLEPIHPGTAEVVRTYGWGAGLRVDSLASAGDLGPEHACLVAQQPDFLGGIVDLEPLAGAAHDAGSLFVTVADPFALGLLRAPGDAGADIVTGEGRDLAGPPNYGGPSVGLFAARNKYLRQMPGRDRRSHQGAGSARTRWGRTPHRIRAHLAGSRTVHPARAGHIERIDRPGVDSGCVHHHRSSARPGRSAPGGGTLLPARPMTPPPASPPCPATRRRSADRGSRSSW